MKECEKYLVGIVTFNREDSFLKVFDSIRKANTQKIIVVKDSSKAHPYSNETMDMLRADEKCILIEHEDNKGVGVAKSTIIDKFKKEFQELENLFIIEDDVIVKDQRVFSYCITYSQNTGLCHFNWNVEEDGSDNHIILCCNFSNCISEEYDTVVTRNVKGHFSYFNRMSLDNFEFDTTFINAFEHIDVEMQLIKKDLLPPFWAFASPRSIGRYLEQNEVESSITGKENYAVNYNKSLKYWLTKWGKGSLLMGSPTEDDIKRKLAVINKRHGKYVSRKLNTIPTNPISIICTIKDRYCLHYTKKEDFLDHEIKTFMSHDMLIRSAYMENINPIKTNKEIFQVETKFYPFINFLKSLNKQANRVNFQIELVVVDWSSKDGPIEETVEYLWDFDFKIVKLPYEQKFSKGLALQKGVEVATYDRLHFTDVDVKYLSTDPLEECSMIEEDEAIFPIIIKEKSPSSLVLYLEILGFGLASMTKELYNKSGGHPDLKKWGKEDTILAERVESLIGPEKFRRPYYRDCIHQFHSDKQRDTK